VADDLISLLSIIYNKKVRLW